MAECTEAERAYLDVLLKGGDQSGAYAARTRVDFERIPTSTLERVIAAERACEAADAARRQAWVQLHEVVGNSPAIDAIEREIERRAREDAPPPG